MSESATYKYLVTINWICLGAKDTICVVADTQDKAKEWISKELEGRKPSGLGVYKVVPVEYWEGKND